MPSTLASKVFNILGASRGLSVPGAAGSGITETTLLMAIAIRICAP
jgi:hypothetical protein